MTNEDDLKLYYSNFKIPNELIECSNRESVKDVYDFLFHHQRDFKKALKLAEFNLHYDEEYWNHKIQECQDAVLSLECNLKGSMNLKEEEKQDPWNGKNRYYNGLLEKKEKGKEACLVYLSKIISTCHSIPKNAFIEAIETAQQIGQLDFVFFLIQLGILENENEEWISFINDFVHV